MKKNKEKIMEEIDPIVKIKPIRTPKQLASSYLAYKMNKVSKPPTSLMQLSEKPKILEEFFIIKKT